MKTLTARVGQATVFQLPEATDAVGAVLYALDRRPPAGLSFDAESRELMVSAAAETLPYWPFLYTATDSLRTVYDRYEVGVFDPLAFSPGPLEVGVPTPLPEPTGGPLPAQRWITDLEGAWLDVVAWSLLAAAVGAVTGTIDMRSGPWSAAAAFEAVAHWRLRTALRHADRNFGDADFQANGDTALGATVKLPHWSAERGPYLALTRPIDAGPLTSVVISNPTLPPRPAVDILSRMERADAVVFGVPVNLYTLSVPDDATYHRAGECLTVA